MSHWVYAWDPDTGLLVPVPSTLNGVPIIQDPDDDEEDTPLIVEDKP